MHLRAAFYVLYIDPEDSSVEELIKLVSNEISIVARHFSTFVAFI